MKVSPPAVTGSAYPTTSLSGLVPPMRTAPSDFSQIVVMPATRLPLDGLLSSSASLRAVYACHQAISSSIRWLTAGVAARFRRMCSAP